MEINHIHKLEGLGLFFKDFIYSFKRHIERGRDTSRGRSRLPTGKPMWDLVSGPSDHALKADAQPLSQRGRTAGCSAQNPLGQCPRAELDGMSSRAHRAPPCRKPRRRWRELPSGLARAASNSVRPKIPNQKPFCRRNTRPGGHWRWIHPQP